MKSASLPDGLADALGRVVFEVRRDFEQESKRGLELLEAQSRAFLAEMASRRVSLEAEIKSAAEARVDAAIAKILPAERGERGEPGEAGPQGERGADGQPGEKGDRGDRGPPGELGADGAQGEKGEQGERGEAGPQGEPGEKGADGRDGVDGKDGRDGVNGAPGPEGPAGKDGKDGENGRDGAPGAPGEKGERGEPGQKGDTGERGADGAPGDRGLEGPPGKLPVVREWAEGVHYEGEVVVHNGATYQAVRDTGRSPPHDDWLCLATAGRDGDDGRSLTIRGTWSDAAEYAALDVVALGGASFVARRDNPGVCPGEGWQLIATQGKQGKPGERGMPGPKGEPGRAGEPVIAAVIDDDGLLTLTNGDGSTVTCDLYPVLTRIAR